jgi:hypothetical protein
VKIENRELFVSFWDDENSQGVYGLLIAWTDELLPVVAYNYGLHTVTGPFEVALNLLDARRNATQARPN